MIDRVARPGVGVLVAVAGAAFLASLTQLSDWDTFHHLAYGRDILRRGGFAPEDPLLYPLAGQPGGVQPSWLGSVVIHLSWVAAGEAGPVYLAGLMGAGLFLVLLRDARDDDRSWHGLALALLPLSFALAVFRERAVARPELFSNILLAWTIIALRRHAAGRGRLLLAFPLVAALWANLHQSFLLGVVVLGIFAGTNAGLLLLRRFWRHAPSEVPGGRALVAPVLAALGGLGAAAALTPGGVSRLLSPIDFIVSVFGRSAGATGAPGGDPLSLLTRMVDELRPPTERQWLGPFGWLVALCALSFPLAWRRPNPRELALCAAFVFLASSAQRFMGLAAIVMAPIAARNLRAAVALGPVSLTRILRWGAFGGGALGVLAAGWVMYDDPGIRFGTGLARGMPVRAARYLESIGFRGRLYNTFHLGGYLEWTLDQKVFQDGRGHLLPGDAAAAWAGPSDYAEFETLDRRYRFDALATHYPQFTDAAMRRRATRWAGGDWGADRTRWALVAFDDGGQVYLRRDGASAAFAARDEYRHAMPAISLAVPQPADAGALRADLERSLREAPDCLRCRTMLGLLMSAGGRREEAEAMLLPAAAQALPETQLFALLGLARVAQQRGDRAAAAARWRRIVALAPDPTWPRRQLAALLLEDGKPAEAWAAIRGNLGVGTAMADDLALGISIARARRDEAGAWELSSRLGVIRAAEQAEHSYRAGEALIGAGRLHDAVAALTRSVQLNARAPAPHFRLAQAHERLGDAQRAAAEYRRYLELAPTGPWSGAARERLASIRETSR